MNKFCFLLAFAAVSLAIPHDLVESTILEEGPWVSEEAWPEYEADRNPKGFLDNLPSPSGFLAGLGNWWTWDRDVVKEGIFKNENIMIHVGQNLFNFVFTTLAWFTFSQIYSLTAGVNNGRQMRAITISEAADEVLDAIRAFEHKHK